MTEVLRMERDGVKYMSSDQQSVTCIKKSQLNAKLKRMRIHVNASDVKQCEEKEKVVYRSP